MTFRNVIVAQLAHSELYNGYITAASVVEMLSGVLNTFTAFLTRKGWERTKCICHTNLVFKKKICLFASSSEEVRKKTHEDCTSEQSRTLLPFCVISLVLVKNDLKFRVRLDMYLSNMYTDAPFYPQISFVYKTGRTHWLP